MYLFLELFVTCFDIFGNEFKEFKKVHNLT